MNPIEAVVFDLGGVVLGSPLEGIADFERENFIPAGFVNFNVLSRGETGAFQVLERGEITVNDFYGKFKAELEDPEQLRKFAKLKGIPAEKLPNHLSVDTVLLFKSMLDRSLLADPNFVHAIYMLRGSGIKVGALTNNFAPMGSISEGSIEIQSLQDLFDEIVESAVEGIRKPDPRAYQLICDRLKVSPTRTAFLDDIGLNLKSAKELGLETFLVKAKDKQAALRGLQIAIQRRNNLKINFETEVTEPNQLFWRLSGDRVLVGDAFGCAYNPPVVLFAGGGQTRFAWTNTCKMLSKNNLFAIAVDIKGHGESYWDKDGDYSPMSFGRDIDELMKKIGLFHRKPIVIGASFGGLSMLSTKFSHNDCGGIVLVDVTPKLEPSGVDKIIQFMGNGINNGFESLDEALEAIRAYTPQRLKTTINLEGLRKNLKYDERTKRYIFNWDPQFLPLAKSQFKDSNLEIFEKLLLDNCKKINCPVLLVRGKLTELISDEGVQSLKSAIPQLKVADVSQAGHMVAGDQNDMFSTEVLAFVSDLKATLLKASLPIFKTSKL